MVGTVYSIQFSQVKGRPWVPVNRAQVVKDFGLESDRRAGDGIKQVSLHSIEGIRRQEQCVRVEESRDGLKPGDFSENMTTVDMDLTGLKLGDQLKVGSDVVLEISKVGKECYEFCSFKDGKDCCVIPREAVFTKVLNGGVIRVGDNIEVVTND